jgi:hypothetical protein
MSSGMMLSGGSSSGVFGGCWVRRGDKDVSDGGGENGGESGEGGGLFRSEGVGGEGGEGDLGEVGGEGVLPLFSIPLVLAMV